jgi:hypothetical protein
MEQPKPGHGVQQWKIDPRVKRAIMPPPVYRPLTIQAKLGMQEEKSGSGAPPVYRPGAEKDAAALLRQGIRPQSRVTASANRALQQFAARNTGLHNPPPFLKQAQGLQRQVQPRPFRPSVTVPVPFLNKRISQPVIQRSARRTNFSYETQKAVKIGSGEHRRHIIPNSLMKDAINNWNAAHGAWSGYQCQQWLDTLNNYQPNLIPGGGTANMASGGIMHQGHTIETSISGLADVNAISTAVTTDYPKVSAFGGTGLARELVNSVVSTVSTFSTAEEMKEFVSDMGHSGGFDWPTPVDSTQAQALYQTWLSVYNMFVFMRDHPDQVSQEGVQLLFSKFLTLPAPTTHH